MNSPAEKRSTRRTGGKTALGLNYYWSVFRVLPCLIHLWAIGGRRWEQPND